MYYGYYSPGIFSEVALEIEQQRMASAGLWKLLHPWLVNGLFNVVASISLIFLSARILNPIHRKK
jgi:hypothetical protein